MRTITAIQQEIIDDFAELSDWEDRYQYMIELGQALPPLAEAYKTEENLVRGCQSKVWLWAYEREGKIYFEADSDAIITRGLVGLLVKVWSGQSAEDILGSTLFFIAETNLQSHLSSTRSNGLMEMIKKMKGYAHSFQKV